MTPPFPFLFLLLLLPSVSSLLPPDQIAVLINASHLVNSTSWDSSSSNPDPCLWHGVLCSPSSSSVLSISLSGFSLPSSSQQLLLPLLCRIDSLRSLDLSDNRLSSIPPGFLSSCGALAGLKLINFSRNVLEGNLPDFPGFPDLESLDLSFNLLDGGVGTQLDGLANLKSLNLSANYFIGSVPVNLGKSLLLEELQLSMNNFSGVIPPEILNFRSLTVLDLGYNSLVGNIPDWLGQLQYLHTLVLSSNKLSGGIPGALSNITSLSRFSANQNHLNGTIPSGLTAHLRSLDLSYNGLSGLVPSGLLSPLNLQYVDLSVNQLEGQIPADLSPNMLRLRLGSNLLKGVIPYAQMETLQKLTYLELDNNSLTGPLLPALGNCQSLALLNLADNQLSGPLPPQLGNLSRLQVLKLQHNGISGGFPEEITGLTYLGQLNISWNQLSGPIPSSISKLRNLTTLHLQNNNLNGSIPDSIGEMGALMELQLGKNLLSGNIPTFPQSLQIVLNLSSNQFEGPIPKTLSQLVNLEVLDLSDNQFSGPVPNFLTQLSALTQIILSNNQLSGIIPNFRAGVVVDYLGNKDLRKRPSPSTPTSGKKKPVALVVLILLSSVVLAVTVALLVVAAVSRRFYRINDEQLSSQENIPLPQVVESNLLTANGIHRSSIDFTKAMEAVADPANIVLKTRFSVYYKATMPSGASYYVKKLDWSDKIYQLGRHDKFGRELEVLGRLNNSNIMTPLGYVLTIHSAYLFYDYPEKGTLAGVLHGRDQLDWASRFSIAVGVAHGLAFLHDCSSGPILLLDLSSRTILLRSLKEPQVGDIELCKVIDPSRSTGSLSTVAGSVGYIPPEYAYTMRITKAGNIYSFGVILLELITGKPSVSDGNELAKWVSTNSSEKEKWDHVLDYRVSRTSQVVRSQMVAVLQIALACVSTSPDARPKMRSVLRMLLNAR
ncbi:hypothetical protein MLD38_024590 [Melastoma candidum]|nr:hypothetical protein MLD38_024590 [Melastoma candidum]